jgi:hypothetical protein
MPYWGSFIENDVCGQHWRLFLHTLKDEDKKLLNQADRVDCLPRLLATGWVACALETFLAFQSPGEWRGTGGILEQVTKIILRGADDVSRGMAGAVRDAEVYVMLTASDIYDKIINYDAKINTKRRKVFLAEKEAISLISFRDWLERQLPLLLSYLYVPVVKKRAEEIAKARKFKDTNLAESWKTNWHYILAEIDFYLETLFPLNEGPEYFESLGPFSNMHRLWRAPGKKRRLTHASE